MPVLQCGFTRVNCSKDTVYDVPSIDFGNNTNVQPDFLISHSQPLFYRLFNSVDSSVTR